MEKIIDLRKSTQPKRKRFVEIGANTYFFGRREQTTAYTLCLWYKTYSGYIIHIADSDSRIAFSSVENPDYIYDYAPVKVEVSIIVNDICPIL